jgi:hypothetical protein
MLPVPTERFLTRSTPADLGDEEGFITPSPVLHNRRCGFKPRQPAINEKSLPLMGTFETCLPVLTMSVHQSGHWQSRQRGPVARSNLAGAMSPVQRATARATGRGACDWAATSIRHQIV